MVLKKTTRRIEEIDRMNEKFWEVVFKYNIPLPIKSFWILEWVNEWEEDVDVIEKVLFEFKNLCFDIKLEVENKQLEEIKKEKQRNWNY